MSTLVLTLFSEERGLLQSSPAPAVKGLWPQGLSSVFQWVAKASLASHALWSPRGSSQGFHLGAGAGEERAGGRGPAFPEPERGSQLLLQLELEEGQASVGS